MQKNDIVEKKRIEYDGEEVDGLVFVGELALKDGEVEVPEFKKIRIIGDGVTKIPSLDVRYKIKLGTSTKKFFRDWHTNKETKDVTIIHTDAHGSEIERNTLPDCECIGYTPISETDSSTPGYAQVAVTIAPYDIIPIEAG